MSLSKPRIIGFAVGIILLACFMDKGIYGYEGQFHESIVGATIEMMISRYPNLPKEFLKKGTTQPDDDRKKAQKRGDLRDNEEHKRNTTRINNNYKDAVDRYKQHAGRGDPKGGLNQGARILAKAFHYVSDQTEPHTGRGFSSLMGGGFRGIVQNMLPGVMANDKAKQLFFGKVSSLCQKYQFNPRDEESVRKEITRIRVGLEEEIKKILKRPNLKEDRAKQQEAKDDIDRLIWDYLAQIVAIQNLMLEQFFIETKIESQTPQPPPEKQTWHGGRWEYWVTRGDGKRVGEGWFEISYNNGAHSLKATHCKTRGCPKAVLLSINNNSLKIRFNDNDDNELEVWRNSPGTIKGKHWSHKNPNPKYREGAHDLQGRKVLRGESSHTTGWK